jgi:Circularly permutated YpsA SLOG family
LDVARELGIASSGWCPQGRKAEDGRLADYYPLKEASTGEYAQRTEWNVRDSDGTLVLTRGRASEGTAYTITTARRLGKPCLALDLSNEEATAAAVLSWAQEHNVRNLNVAGPRESKCPGIYTQAKEFLRQLFSHAE